MNVEEFYKGTFSAEYKRPSFKLLDLYLDTEEELIQNDNNATLKIGHIFGGNDFFSGGTRNEVFKTESSYLIPIGTKLTLEDFKGIFAHAHRSFYALLHQGERNTGSRLTKDIGLESDDILYPKLKNLLNAYLSL